MAATYTLSAHLAKVIAASWSENCSQIKVPPPNAVPSDNLTAFHPWTSPDGKDKVRDSPNKQLKTT
ncbi:hypothetical protein BFJ71_g8097 [Fusarium oxysporum]|nr:hypothetical protein BFJ71_g8097 [Fusarium oxysporum]